MSKPWDHWVPGVLSKRQLQELRGNKNIQGITTDGAFDYSSFDLSLSDKAYQMKGRCVQAPGRDYLATLENLDCIEKLPRENGAFVLRPREHYVFLLREKLNFGRRVPIFGQATAKSTTGRLDVLARLVVDGMDSYDNFNPDGLKEGNHDLLLEITPMTFGIRVQEGDRLSQLRLFYGHPEDSIIRSREDIYGSFVKSPLESDGIHESLSLDLEPCGDLKACAFKTIGNPAKLAPVAFAKGKNCPCLYWSIVQPGKSNSLRLRKDAFYLLRSAERLTLSGGVAVYCRAIDETIGEMRIHYAGFAHPFFGMERQEPMGTPLIFEVRSHDMDINLHAGARMAKLTFYRMSEDCRQEETTQTGGLPASKRSDYADQTLKLSNCFRDWPQDMEVGTDGSVRSCSCTECGNCKNVQ